jgi:vacuolar-type H+-ATPase subunit F/Vma7
MVGEKYLAVGFRLAGVRTIPTDSDDETIERLTELIKDQKIGMIIITERMAMKLQTFRERLYKTEKSPPIFIIVPDFQGSLNERARELHQLVNRAVGMELKLGD